MQRATSCIRNLRRRVSEVTVIPYISRIDSCVLLVTPALEYFFHYIRSQIYGGIRGDMGDTAGNSGIQRDVVAGYNAGYSGII